MTNRTAEPEAAHGDETAEGPSVLPLLTRDGILAQRGKLATERVDVPEWGGAVIVRALTGKERDAYEAGIFKTSVEGGEVHTEHTPENLRARLCSLSVVDEAGTRMFSEADVLALGELDAGALERVFSVAQRLSRLSAKDMKELQKQLGSGRNGASGSA